MNDKILDFKYAVAEAIHENGNALAPLAILVGEHIRDAEAADVFAVSVARLTAANKALREALRVFENPK